MELMIAERIKQYRKERNMTQDALAQALWVSPKSVFKWECGDGYPDITLLPAIANYFEVTVDELIGNDEISAKEDVQKNYFNAVNKLSPDEKLDLAMKYHKKYPRNWHIATSLLYEITRRHRDKLEEYKPLLNEIAERIFNECTDSVSRRSAAKSMCMICDDNEVKKWLKRDSQFWHEEWIDVFEERYRLIGEDELYRATRYAGNFVRAAHSIDRLRVRPDYIGKPDASAAWNSMHLHILDGYTCRKTDEDITDGWIGEYGAVYARLAAAYFGLDEKETGYEYLEKALRLNERWSEIPDQAPLDLGNPLVFGETKILKNNWHILMPDGALTMHVNGISHWLHPLARTMTAPSGWEWFDTVRGEERWNAILARAKALIESE